MNEENPSDVICDERANEINVFYNNFKSCIR